MQHYWFGDVDGEVCVPVKNDISAIAARIASLSITMDAFTPLDWESALRCGFVASRDEYLSLLRRVTSQIAEQKISAFYGQRDIELLQMVRMLDELDTVINLLTERAVDWYQVRNPGFSRKYRTLPAKKMAAILRRNQSPLFRKLAGEIDHLAAVRLDLAKAVSYNANTVAPNCSALVGGLVAARLIARAGGLAQLARFPASTIQVLGAENALFTHLKAGTPSPKHGIIFQHKRVHNASKERRGRVARVLAGKLGIAARIDYYRGELVPEFINKAQKRIDEAGDQHAVD